MAKAQTPAPETTSDDEVEELDDIEETAEASTEAAPKKAKAAKVERTGTSVKDLAATLNMTPVRLRRILRSMPAFTDNAYTRYDLTDEQIVEIKAFITKSQADSAEKKAAKAAAKEAGSSESTAEDAGEELEDLEDSNDADSEDDDEDDDE